MCVIADDRAVLGFGGVMGGEETGFTEATTNVLIECAYFDPQRTARTGRRLGIQTDARFGSSAASIPTSSSGLELATDMMLELCGGEAEQGRDRRQGCRKPNAPFAFDFGRVKS